MPRQPRQKSESGIYHIMLRGINQQVIFEEDEDYKKFIDTLETYKAVSGYKVFAYCLMSNHIHILIKVGIVEKIDEYEYSSYNEYVSGESSLIDREFVYSLLSKENFEEFNREKTEDVCMDIEELNFRLSDNDAMKIIREVSKCESATEFQTLDSNDRDKYIRKLKNKGLSIRQISRLTGISKGIVERIE